MDNKFRSNNISHFIPSMDNKPDTDGNIEVRNLVSPFLKRNDQVDVQLVPPEAFESTHSQGINLQANHQHYFDSAPDAPTTSNQQISHISATHQVIDDCITTQSPSHRISPLIDQSQVPLIPQSEPVLQSAQTAPVPASYTNIDQSQVPLIPQSEPVLQSAQTAPVPASYANVVMSQVHSKQMQYYRSQKAFTTVHSTQYGLTAYDKYGNPYVVFPFHFKSCYFVKLDPEYNQHSYYHISFWEKPDPLIIAENDFNNPGKLIQALSSHFPKPVDNTAAIRKINAAIRFFFIDNTITHPIKFYAGWTNPNESWEYCLLGEKTHGSKAFSAKSYDPSNIDNNSFTNKDMTVPVQLTAVRQVAEMLNIIADIPMRNIIFNILHIASLYSLLPELTNRFPLGFCLHCNDAFTLSILEGLFSWFSDNIINLSEDKQRFYTLLTERKDQPLLIMDTKAQMTNTNMLEEAIKTGIIAKNKSHNTLYALPIVLSNLSSHISQSSNFIRFNLQSHQFTPNAKQTIHEKHSYFMSYLYYFNVFVQNHIAEFQKALTKHTDAILNKYADYSLSKDCSMAFGIICAVEEIIKGYHASLYPDTSTEQLLQDLFSKQTEDSLVDTFSYISCQDSDTTITNVFFSTANQMIQDGSFDIREFGNDNTFAPCPNTKQGIIYIYNSDPCFSKQAFEAVVSCTGYDIGAVKQALLHVNAFNSTFANTDAYQYRISRKNPITGKDYTPVYRFTTESIKIPHRPHNLTFEKQPEEYDFMLKLGTAINGDPIKWYGMMSSHICITGKSGSGKSYFLKKQIMQLPAQNARCIIFDTKGTFTSTEPQKSPSEWSLSNMDIINMSNSKAQHIFFQPLFANESYNTIISRFVEIVKKTTVLGTNQKNELIKILEDGLKNKEISNFIDLINAITNKAKTANKGSSLVSKIGEMNRILPYGEEPFDLQLDKPGITILDFYHGFDKSTVSTVANLILSVISNSRLAAASDNNTPIILVLDECQIFDWRSSSPAHTILTQGREAGLSIWFCTQYLEQVNDPKVLGQADFRIHFRPADDDIPKISKLICRSTRTKTQYCENQLLNLVQGQFICTINNELYISETPPKYR